MSAKSTTYMPSPFNKYMPKPVYDNWAWQEKGLCNGSDSEVFFYEDMERGDEKNDRIRAAVAICQSCPVIETCRQFAFDTHQNYGVWGGLTQEQRAKITRTTIH